MRADPEDFERAVEFVLEVEGGYSDRPVWEDPGGKTNYGITESFLQAIGGWRGKHSVLELTRSDAVELYRRYFWERYGCDQLPWPLNLAVFDHCVNAGSWGIKVLQGLVEVRADGVLGPQTLQAVDKALETYDGVTHLLALAYLFRRLEDYANRPAPTVRRANMSGWANRVCRLARLILRDYLSSPEE